MSQKPTKFIHAKTWISIIIVVNIILFVIYLLSHPEPNFAGHLWAYLNSGLFKLVTGSLILPLLFSVLEKRYKFIENIEKEREERRKRNEEIKRQTRQEAINETISMWQDLYALSTEVILLNIDNDIEEHIDDLARKMINFSNVAEQIVNRWRHQFPNLSFDDHDLFLEFVNILYQSSDSVIFYLQTGNDYKEKKMLKDMLFQIRDQVKNIANHTTINILKNSAEYLRLKESDGTEEQIREARDKIDTDIELLRGWYNEVHRINKDHDNLLVPLEGDQIEAIRKTARSIESWLKEDKSRFFFDSAEANSFQDQYKKIPFEDRLLALRVPYSKEYLRALTEYFSVESACNYIYNRAHGAW